MVFYTDCISRSQLLDFTASSAIKTKFRLVPAFIFQTQYILFTFGGDMVVKISFCLHLQYEFAAILQAHLK